MKRNLHIMIYLLLGIMVFPSCNKFLDVKPEDQFIEEQVFSNEMSIQQAFNGIYVKLAGSSLYGAALTTTSIELIGQRYNITPLTTDELLQKFSYTSPGATTIFDNIWKEAFATILKTNKFLTSLQTAQENGVISTSKAEIMKGEALAIRAMVHFDLLRLFGPVYLTGSNKPAIPYYTEGDAQLQPILTAADAVNRVIADLNTAASLLSQDYVINNGVVTGSNEFYTSFRNRRFNYFAVRAIQARVFLYAGKNADASKAALDVLERGEKWFPWLPFDAILTGTNPDRIFSTEVILGLDNQSMYTSYLTYFSPDVNTGLLTALPARLQATFENNTNDYRYTTTWLNSSKNVRTFHKFADLPDQTKPWRFLQPLVRKSELYYILAETESDKARAIKYLNTVRANRGLTELALTADLKAQLQLEYQKEFFGEGQIFFFYKRINALTVPSAVNAFSNIFNPGYVVPLPASEVLNR